jgi:beta-galactosidase
VEARVRTAWDARGLLIDPGGAARSVPFWAGSYHYWRSEPGQWKAGLRAIAELGLLLVETPVPWSVHETASRYTWSGRADLARFVGLAGEAGLGVVLRPGPCVGAELTYLGFPERLLRDGDLLARTAHGTPAWLPLPPRMFPVPSYASARFHEQVAAWYAALAEVVAPLLAPDGPVVALAVDHQAQLFHRLGAYDLDYHPDAIAWWHDDGGHGEPPRAWDPAHAERCAHWVRFKDRYRARALGRFAAALDEVGLGGVARYHDVAPGDPAHGALPGIETAIGGPVGIGVHNGRHGFAAVRRRALHVVGSQDVPLAPQVALSASPFLVQPDRDADPDRPRDALLTLLAAGVRGFGLETAVERDRYLGGAIDGRGHVVPGASWIAPLLGALRAADWTSLRRAAPIAVVLGRADWRFALASSVVDPVTPVIADALGLGAGGAAELGRDGQGALARRWLAAIEDALTLAEIPYVIVDEAAPIERLRGYAAVIAPTLDRVDRGLWKALKTLADEKAVVVIGPGVPTHDELGAPLGDDAAPPKRSGRIRPGSLGDGAGLAEDLASLAGDPPEAWLVDHPDDVDCAAFADAGGAVRVVFVCSRGDHAETAELIAPDGAVLRDPFTGETLTAGNGRVRVRVPDRGVRLLIVESA